MSEEVLTIEVPDTIEKQAVIDALLNIPGAAVKTVEETITIERVVGVTIPVDAALAVTRRLA